MWLLRSRGRHRPTKSDLDAVSVNPNIRFGRPAVRGISTAAIAEQSESGASNDEIARDYGISEAAVRNALAYERNARPYPLPLVDSWEACRTWGLEPTSQWQQLMKRLSR